MLPNPLHPAVVHFPLVLAMLLPFSVVGALWAIRRGVMPRRAWSLPLIMAAILGLSAWVGVRTGEAEEEVVEAVVPESALHTHEEAAERFLLLSGVLLAMAAVGLARGNLGTAARLASAVGSLVVLGAALQVGAAGGKLVYEHNAGSAYMTGTSAAAVQDTGGEEHED